MASNYFGFFSIVTLTSKAMQEFPVIGEFGILGRVFLGALLCVTFYSAWADEKNVKDEIKFYESIFGLEFGDPDEEIRALLQFLSNRHLKMNNDNRVSVYKYDSNIDKFLRIARFSRNPIFNQGGAKEFSRTHGVIGSAWNATEGECKIENLPCPEKHIDDHITALREQNAELPKSELKTKRMKSRSYYAFRVLNPDESSYMAVIVFESVSQSGFSSNKIKKLLKS